jgi:hypothetical protein
MAGEGSRDKPRHVFVTKTRKLNFGDLLFRAGA